MKKSKAEPSLKDQKKLVKKASESISYKVGVERSLARQFSDVNGLRKKNFPCRKSERQLKFRVLDRGVENTICYMFYVRKSQIKG